MVWSLDQDDFSNSCGNGPYPLMNVLRGRLSGITIPTQPLASSTPQSSGVVDRQSTTVGVTGLSITNAHSSTGFQTNTPLSSKQPSSTPLTSNHLATSTVAPSAGLSSCGGLCWKIDNRIFYFVQILVLIYVNITWSFSASVVCGRTAIWGQLRCTQVLPVCLGSGPPVSVRDRDGVGRTDQEL